MHAVFFGYRKRFVCKNINQNEITKETVSYCKKLRTIWHSLFIARLLIIKKTVKENEQNELDFMSVIV